MASAMRHPTTQVETDDTDILRTRLKNDLRRCESVTMVRDDAVDPRAIVFETKNSDMSPDVTNVLGDHDATIPKQQPNKETVHSARIA